MNKKKLIRRALMGDKQAQKECTAKGIVLPCPFCGSYLKNFNVIDPEKEDFTLIAVKTTL